MARQGVVWQGAVWRGKGPNGTERKSEVDRKTLFLRGDKTPRDVEVQALLQLLSVRLEERGQTVTIAEIEAVIGMPYTSGAGRGIVRRVRRGLRAAGIETVAVAGVGIRSLPDAEIAPTVVHTVGKLRRGLRRQVPILQNVRAEEVSPAQLGIRDHLLANTAVEVLNLRRMERETKQQIHLTYRAPAPSFAPPKQVAE